MKIVALIPARGGSKRLPGKNIKMLGEMPLIAWTIHAARESECCSDILVSTNDPEIADIARKHGASVPWLRPAQLSTDTASSVDVAIHALDAYEKTNGAVDGVLLLQPTSPFRTPQSIKEAVALFSEDDGFDPVVSVSQAISHPAWCFRETEKRMEPFLGWESVFKRSQDLEPAWMLNGSIYLTSPKSLRKEKKFITKKTKLLKIINERESLDIDTSDDFDQACLALIHHK